MPANVPTANVFPAPSPSECSASPAINTPDPAFMACKAAALCPCVNCTPSIRRKLCGCTATNSTCCCLAVPIRAGIQKAVNADTPVTPCTCRGIAAARLADSGVMGLNTNASGNCAGNSHDSSRPMPRACMETKNDTAASNAAAIIPARYGDAEAENKVGSICHNHANGRLNIRSNAATVTGAKATAAKSTNGAPTSTYAQSAQIGLGICQRIICNNKAPIPTHKAGRNDFALAGLPILATAAMGVTRHALYTGNAIPTAAASNPAVPAMTKLSTPG